MAKIRDEEGRAWLVLKGDPAYPLITRLHKLGRKDEEIILPTHVILSGDLPPRPSYAQVNDLYKLYKQLENNFPQSEALPLVLDLFKSQMCLFLTCSLLYGDGTLEDDAMEAPDAEGGIFGS